jgi:transmembrane sensor
MDIKQFQTLCAKQLTGNLSEGEKVIFDKLLSRSSDYKNEFEKIKLIWEQSAPNKNSSMPDADTEWKLLYDRLELDKIQRVHKESIFDKIYFYFQSAFALKQRLAIGSSFAIILLVISLFILNNINTDPRYKLIATGNKEIKEVQLPDGSTVKLNNGSSIQFLENFNADEREVKLEGEAFFSVTKNSHPFVVVTNNAKITVLGTKFDVCVRGERTNVVVKEGKVKFVQKEHNDAGVYLLKGQASSITKNFAPNLPEEVNSDYLLGWINGKLVFNEAPLNEIVEELERFYDIPISVENNNLYSSTLTGSFKNHDVDSVLTMICLTLNLDFEKQQGSYLIKAKKISN